MQRKHILLLLGVTLIVLVVGQVFRYEDLAYSPTVQRYIDHWTGHEWVKTYSWSGLSHCPAKYFSSTLPVGMSEVQVLQEIKKMQFMTRFLTMAWLAAVSLLSFSMVNMFVKMRNKG